MHPTTPHSIRRAPVLRRRLAIGATALVGILALTGCLPGTPLASWVPDYNGDGRISADETAWRRAQLAQAFADAVEAQRRETQRHPFLVCVRRHESDRTGYPYIDGYRAQNPTSSASGAYQFLDSTWRTSSARAGHGGYWRASSAPWYVQDAVALYEYRHGGRSHWAGSGC